MASVLTSIRARIHPTDDKHHVTTLELLFDLVFVFAITNVTALIEHHPGGRTLLEGAVVLSIVWFGWCAYAWLGNQAVADEGLLRVAMVFAMAGMFFVAVSVPNVFSEHSNAAVVLTAAYFAVRMIHVGVYLVAAGEDRALRSVLTTMATLNVAMFAIMLVGTLVDPHTRLWWWLAAVVFDQVGVYFARSTRWTLNSASHFAERFGLIVLIAIGESVVDVGNASIVAQMDFRLAGALLCGVAIAVCLWWLYFDVVSTVGEEVLTAATGVARARLARDSYTFIHLPMIAGIVAAAMGANLLVKGHEHVDAGRYALYGGLALYLFAHLLFRARNLGSVNIGRAVAMGLLVVLIPVTAGLPSLVMLVIPAAILVGLVASETWTYRVWRAELRRRPASGGESPAEVSDENSDAPRWKNAPSERPDVPTHP